MTSAGLLAVSHDNYPNLHTILDTGIFLLAAVLALLLWDKSARLGNRLGGLLAISFLVTGLLDFIHVAVTLDWSGTFGPVAQAAEWGPAAYVLPIGIGSSVWLLARDRKPQLRFGLGLIALSGGLVAAFYSILPYAPPRWLGITRPALIGVPQLWVIVGYACWHMRRRDRMLPRLALMAVVLGLANVAMLYSRAPSDNQAMATHIGVIAGFLTLLLTIMHLGSLDLVARFTAERQLATLNQELEHRVLERTEELAASNQRLEAESIVRKEKEQELKRSNEELGRFAYVASHDLQEPLRMVASYVQLLAKRYQGKLDADADEFIGYAVDGALRMQRLIEDLLAYSRVGSQGAALVPTDAALVLDRAQANLKLAIDEVEASVTHDQLPTVMADAGQLEHVFQNLIANALKFHGPERPKVHISAVHDNGRWRFGVRDNGIGIAAEYFDRIFVIFQRLHGPTEYAGTGIGLSVTRKIVERHGGRIWVESEPGRGTTFFFTLSASTPGSSNAP